jgi:hypothetical protein
MIVMHLQRVKVMSSQTVFAVIGGTDIAFYVDLELASLCSLRGIMTGEDLFLKVKGTVFFKLG